MELATARAGAGGGTIALIGVLTIASFIGGERATVVAGILILHTGLIGNDGIAGGIEGLAVQEGVEGGGTGPAERTGKQKRGGNEYTQEHSKFRLQNPCLTSHGCSNHVYSSESSYLMG
jgi:hypothetical protein